MHNRYFISVSCLPELIFSKRNVNLFIINLQYLSIQVNKLHSAPIIHEICCRHPISKRGKIFDPITQQYLLHNFFKHYQTFS